MTSRRGPRSQASSDSAAGEGAGARSSRRSRAHSKNSLSGSERLRRRRQGFVDALRDLQGEAESEVGWAPRSGPWVLLAVSVAVGFALSRALPSREPSSRALPRAQPGGSSPRELDSHKGISRGSDA